MYIGRLAGCNTFKLFNDFNNVKDNNVYYFYNYYNRNTPSSSVDRRYLFNSNNNPAWSTLNDWTITFDSSDIITGTRIDGAQIWTDGEDIYSSPSQRLYLYKADFVNKTWTSVSINKSLTYGGRNIWTDGTDIYYSYSYDNYIWDKTNKSWSDITITGISNVSNNHGEYIWTDGEDVYLSQNTLQFKFDKVNKVWTTAPWADSINGDRVWTDGENIYYSATTAHKIFNKTSKSWSDITFTGSLTNFNGALGCWTDGINVYYSQNSTDIHILNKSTRVWTKLSITNPFSMTGNSLFTVPISSPKSGMYYYTNNTFQPCTAHYYDGTSFVECEPYYYDGTEFKQLTIE